MKPKPNQETADDSAFTAATCSVPLLEGPDRFGNYNWKCPNGGSRPAQPRDAVLVAILHELKAQNSKVNHEPES